MQQRDKLKPILFSIIKHSSKEELKEQIPKDIVAGVVVAVVALPLSIALGIASGVSPEQGLYTAIVAGFLIAFLGGSRVQISGSTAAFATIVAGIVATDGMEGLIAATIIAGILLVLMGLFKLGAIIRFVPFTITTGFTAGIAVTLTIGQLKDFFGLTYPPDTVTVETTEKLAALVGNFSTVNWQACLVGVVCLAILFLWPRVTERVPSSLVALLAGIALVSGLGLEVSTIGDLYVIDSALPAFRMPELTLELFRDQFANGVTIAILAAIESLLSCVVADSMISGHHRANMELVAQGVGNIASVLFGGIPATGAIARTAANVKAGGRTPIAGMVHALVLVAVLAFLDALCGAHSHAHHRRYFAVRRLQHVRLAQLRAPVPDGVEGSRCHARAHLRADHRVRSGGGHRRGHAHHRGAVHEDGERGDRGQGLEVLLRRELRGHAFARAAEERARVRDQRADVLRHDRAHRRHLGEGFHPLSDYPHARCSLAGRHGYERAGEPVRLLQLPMGCVSSSRM